METAGARSDFKNRSFSNLIQEIRKTSRNGNTRPRITNQRYECNNSIERFLNRWLKLWNNEVKPTNNRFRK